jgi:CubicO group peptidase (beta-lactamase class C family)
MLALQSILDRGVAERRAPGFAAAVLTPDGATHFATAGVLGVDNPTPVTNDTPFWIASCTKAITSVAALQLVERGSLDLDEPVGPYLPTLAEPRVLEGFDEKGMPALRPARVRITLRHLLSHTSGLGYDFCNAELKRFALVTGSALLGGEKPDVPLVFEPGEGWQYGIGIDWTGKLIEAVTGKELGAYVEENILEPLAMRDTAFFLNDAQSARKARVHQKLADGMFVASPFAMPAAPHFMMGGAGLHATAPDYLKFLKVIAGGGAPLLKAETFTLAMQNHSGKFGAGALKSSDPVFSNDFEPLAGLRQHAGLIGLVNRDPVPGGRSQGSVTWAGIANCYWWADPVSRAAGVVMAQFLPFADRGVLGVFDEIEHAVYAQGEERC